MRPVDIDENKLINLYVDQQKTVRECVQLIGVSESVIRRRLKKLGIKIRSTDKRRLKQITDEMVVELYWEKNLSISKTAEQLGCSDGLVKKRLASSGRGTRTVKEGARLWRGSDDIPDAKLIYMHDVLCMSCRQISAYFGKSEEFVRQRFMAINKDRRKNVGKFNGSWKGGITDVRNSIRSGQSMAAWRNHLFALNKYRSEFSSRTGVLNCHHICPVRVILKSSITKHSCLPDEYMNLAILHDQRFYDIENGLVVTKDEHDAIESFHDKSHPWWKIWMLDRRYATNKSGLSTKDFEAFDDNGMIAPYDCVLCRSKIREIRNIIRYEHYLGTIPVSKVLLAAKVGDILVGVATFGYGTNKNIGENTIELTRLCVPYYVHRPFSCDFVGMCVDYIRLHYPDIKRIVAFADSSAGHDGGIYRIAGWNKAGRTPPSYVYFDTKTFTLRHKAACRRIKGIDMTEKELAESRGWIKVPTQHKYKYEILI